MDLVLTDKCKDKIIHAKDGIKFALKGYAFYSDDLPDGILENELLITHLDLDLLVLNEYKADVSNEETEIKDALFDLTYIPSLEGSVIDKSEDGTEELICKFGTYEIPINKGMFKTLPTSLNYILLFGEEFSEDANVVYDRNKTYLAGWIPVNYDLEEDVEFNPRKIIFQLSLADIAQTDIKSTYQILVDETFDDITENEKLQNINLLNLEDNFTLTPNEKNNDYSEDVSYIREGDANTKFFPGNITLFDKTDKINNPWNTTPRVYVGLQKPNDVSLPHVQLLNVDNKEDSVEINSLTIQFSPEHRFLSINQDDGNDYIQADIFPEDVDEENKICLKDKLKRKNVTFDYSATSAAKSYFRFDSNGSYYGDGAYHIFENDCRGNQIPSIYLPTEYVTTMYSDYNTLQGENNEILVMDSDNNDIGNGINELTLINTFNSIIKNNARTFEEGDNIGQAAITLNQNTLIGVTGLNSNLDVPFIGNNITFIGQNNNVTYVPNTANEMLDFDTIKRVKGTFKRFYDSVDNNTKVYDYINDTVNVDLKHTNEFSGVGLIENQALIGFNGLTVNKIPNHEYFYSKQYQIGYSKELNQYDYYYYGDVTAQPNRNFSVVFGSYNANDNLDAISAITGLDASQAFGLKGKYSNVENSSFSSYYNNKFTYATDRVYADQVSAVTEIHKLYFKHTQDSTYTDPSISAEWYNLTADEGDFGLNRIVVVGNGTQHTDINVTGHSPAEFASKSTIYGDNTRRSNLFSIEKNSFQLVHNGVYDENPHYSATNVMNIPSMFAVRGSDPITQTYTYHFFSGTSGENNDVFINKEMYESKNLYNLHHSVYTPTGIFIPLHRSSNDLYKLNFQNVKGLINDNYIKGNKDVSYEALKNMMNFKQYTFILPTSGLTFRYVNGSNTLVKGSKGKGKGVSSKGKGKGKGSTKGSGVTYRYETLTNFNMKNLIDWYAYNQDTFIPMSNQYGSDTHLYTFYIINNNPYKGLKMKGFRMNKSGNSMQTLYKSKYIPKGHCLRVDYMDCGAKGKYGVMNFDYWNQNTNSFYK